MTTAEQIAELTARIKAAGRARAEKLAPVGTLPKVGDVVVNLRGWRGRCATSSKDAVSVDFEGTILVVSPAYFSGRAAWRVQPV